MSAQAASALGASCEARLAEVERKLTALSNALVLAGQVAGCPDVARAAETAMRPALAVVTALNDGDRVVGVKDWAAWRGVAGCETSATGNEGSPQ